MTGQSDEKNGERAPKPSALDGPGGGNAPLPIGAPDAANGTVSEDVARVVNLLQRLDKLHSNPSPLANPLPLDAGSRGAPAHESTNTRAPGADGLSSLSGLRDRSRGAASMPVPYLVPPTLPPTLPPAADRDAVLGNVRPDPVALVPKQQGVLENKTEHGVAVGPLRSAGGSTQAARVPLVLIGSMIVGFVAVGAWALFEVQGGGAGVKRAEREPTNAAIAPAQARMDAVAGVAPPLAEVPEGIAMAGCGHVSLRAGKGVLTLAVTDPTRAGQTIPVAVGDVALSATFGPAGRLQLRAPLLGESAAVRWAGSADATCESTAVLASDGALLRVALVSSGAGALDLHVIEPNAWFGGPSGHISNLAPNADKARGAGAIETFGNRDGSRVVVYAVDPARIPAGGLINAFVQPDSAGIPSCGDAVTSVGDRQILYQIHILRSVPGLALQRDIRNFSMQLPSCAEPGASAVPSERIMVRN